jgi:hypothetical protein
MTATQEVLAISCTPWVLTNMILPLSTEAPLGLFKFISDYLPYFEKITGKYIFQYHSKKNLN